MQAIQAFLTKNKKTIVGFLKLGWLSIILLFVITTQVPGLNKFWKDLGKFAATTSIITFWLTLLPGIMMRLRINKPPIALTVRTLLMLYRRQLGITMYVFASVHYGWSRVLPVLAVGGNLLDVSLFEAMGFSAFMLATPLFLTSNDFSQHGKLKKIWPKIHSLTYIIIWLLFLHTALNEAGIRAIITLIIAVLETISLLASWQRKKQVKNKLIA